MRELVRVYPRVRRVGCYWLCKIEFDDPELDTEQLDRIYFAENGYVRRLLKCIQESNLIKMFKIERTYQSVEELEVNNRNYTNSIHFENQINESRYYK